MTIEAVVFDIGGVLLDWNPRYLYGPLIPDAAELERFLSEVCSPAWNATLDEGRSFDEACATLAEQFPNEASLIHAWKRQDEMIRGVMPGMTDIVDRLESRDLPRFLLTNMPTHIFQRRRERFPILRQFQGSVVSGDVGLLKPDRRIFELLMRRFDLAPADTLFVDDAEINVRGAEAAGFQAHLFTDAPTLAEALRAGG